MSLPASQSGSPTLPARYAAGAWAYGLPATLLAATVAVSLYRMRGSYLFVDDFLYFIAYVELGLRKVYLLGSIFSEIVPAVRLTVAFMFEVFGANYTAYAVLIIAWSLGVVALAWWLALRLGASHLAAFFFLTFFTFGLPLTSVQQWFSAAVYILPALICSLLATHVLLSAIASERRRWDLELLAALCFGCGLAYFPKTMFQTALIGAVLVYAYWRLKPSASLFAALLRAVAPMTFILILCAINAVLLLCVGHGLKTGISPSLIAEFTLNGLVNGQLLQFFGLGERGFTAQSGQAVAIVAVVIAIAGAIVLSVRARGPAILILWLALLTYTTAAMMLMSTERAAIFGVSAASSPRYSMEGQLFMALTLAIGLSPVLERIRCELAFGGFLIVAASGGVAFALFQASTLLAPHWDSASVRVYLENLKSDLKALPASGVRLCEGVVPDVIIPNWMRGPDDIGRVSRFIVVIDRTMAVSSTNCNYRILPNGRLQPVR